MVYRLRQAAYYMLILLLCLSGPAVLAAWKWFVEPNWGTADAVVALKAVERGARLAETDVKLMKIRKETRVDGAVTRLSEALGKETTRSIRAGEQLTPEMINTKHLVPGKDEWNMPLPADWIFGKPPGSLLRGDRISLLLIDKEDAGKAEGRADVSPDKLERTNIPLEAEAKLQNMTVSYAKGTNNQEIAPSEDRKKPSGAVSSIEVIATDEQKEIIRRYGMKGYRFLIVYR
ncbi:SAF domain-containing protein [Paenibacillus hamazuiensis]|uniref:SAF domain-containing protein n=1 Tax=Paenibacillus hamazuiensis TaxID=2936508 RepID=UPI00200F7127|nr:SAF domain-containing protein [Paenibacillus hamazuiensis]